MAWSVSTDWYCPDDSIDTRVWEPESKNIYTDFGDYNIVAGYVYEYDVDKNIKLMRRFYPDMRRVAFILSSTYKCNFLGADNKQ